MNITTSKSLCSDALNAVNICSWQFTVKTAVLSLMAIITYNWKSNGYNRSIDILKAKENDEQPFHPLISCDRFRGKYSCPTVLDYIPDTSSLGVLAATL